MLKKMLGLVVAVLLVHFACGQSEKKSIFKKFSLPDSSKAYFNRLVIIDTNLVSVPYHGGLYAAGLDAWYLPPPSSGLYTDAQFSYRDSTLYVVRMDSLGSVLISFKNVNGKTLQTKLQSFGKEIVISELSDDQQVHFNTVTGKKWLWYKLFNKELFLKGMFDFFPSAIKIVNDTLAFIADSATIWKIDQTLEPEVYMRYKKALEGFEFDDEGRVYLSNEDGTFVISKNGQLCLSSKYHGTIKIFDNFLFILSLQHFCVFRIEIQPEF
jgi:hypothetical protein